MITALTQTQPSHQTWKWLEGLFIRLCGCILKGDKYVCWYLQGDILCWHIPGLSLMCLWHSVNSISQRKLLSYLSDWDHHEMYWSLFWWTWTKCISNSIYLQIGDKLKDFVRKLRHRAKKQPCDKVICHISALRWQCYFDKGQIQHIT